MTCHCGRPIRDEGADECRRCQAITRGKQARFGAAQRARFRDEPGLPAHLQPTTPRTDPTIPDVTETQEILERARQTDRPEVAEARDRIAELRQEVHRG